MPDFKLEETPSQKGRVAIITGANTGLGFESARALAAREMKVVMAVRDYQKGVDAKNRILQEHPGADIVIMTVDLADLSSVRGFAADYLSQFDRVDLLINNAGVMIPPYCKTRDGFELQIGVNYFAHFLLTGLLFRTIVRTEGSRIISLASNAHIKAYINFSDINWENGYNRLKAYRQSKLACLVFAFELQRRLNRAGLKTLSVAAHPGLSVTDLVRHIPSWLMTISKPLTALITHPPEKGALPILYAAVAPDVKGGEYFGPQGYSEWTGKPGRAKATALSRDEELGIELWDLSEKLTGYQFSV